MSDTKTARIIECSTDGCESSWFQIGPDHARAIRRARIAGWRGDGSTGCLCANRRRWCPDHAPKDPR